MNFRGGVSIPQNKEFQIMDSWMPVTPEKPIPTRSNLIPVDCHGNQLGSGNWQELNGFSNGYAGEMPNCNGLRLISNPIGQMVQNGGFNGYDEGGLAERNRMMINHIAGSYTQTFQNDSSGWKRDPLAKLLLMQNAAFISSANMNPNRSFNMATNRPLISNSHLHSQSLSQSHSQADCNQKSSILGNTWFENQNHLSGSIPLSNLANGTLFPEFHSQVDNNQRDSDFASLFYANQTHFSGSNSLNESEITSQISKHEYSMPYQQQCDLNYPPPEIDASSIVTNTLQFAPITSDQVNKLENNQLSATLQTRNESPSGAKENETTPTSFGNKAPQQHGDELLQSIVDSSSAAVCTPYKENKETEKGSNPGIDLNKTPEQKPPRRRKHRPKVIREAKPKRTPKSTTPKNTKETPTGKRKYVRKNAQKASAPEPADATMGTVDLNGGTAAKTCRRALNFNLEKTVDESQIKVVGQLELQQRNERTFGLSSDPRAKQLCPGTNGVPGTKSAVQIEQWKTVEYQQHGMICNLIPSTQLQTDCRPQQKRQVPAKDLLEGSHIIQRNVDGGFTDPCQNSSRNRFTPIWQIHAEGIDKRDFQAKVHHERIEKEMCQSTPRSVKKSPSNSSAMRGSKREHFCTIEQMNPNIQNPVISSLYQQIQVDECHSNGQVLGTRFSEACKKKKIGSGLHTNTCEMPCVAEVEAGSRNVETKKMSDNSANEFAPTANHEILNPYYETGIITERQGEINNFTAERCNHSKTAKQYLMMQHSSSRLHSNAERTDETNRLNSAHSFPSLAAIKDCHLLQPSPHKQAQELENQVQTSHVHTLATKQTLECTTSRLVSVRRNKVQKKQDASQDYQKSSPKPRGRPPAKRINPISIDEIMYRLTSLNLNAGSNELVSGEKNALVLFKGDGALVPYAGFEFLKKRKPRPKVDLDPETNRIWNLLMGKEGNKDFEGTDTEKEKWWEEERKVFRGRTDSFIARMHLIQGDRRFSRWKGSVVDSVIGVFLTQNVSDHLSSSAFMSLAARFPLKSTSNCNTCDNTGTSILFKESEICIVNQDDTVRWHGKNSSQPIYNISSMEPLGSAEHHRGSETTGTERRIVQGHSQSIEEEVISSQESFDSLIIQGSGGPRSSSGSNSEEEDLITGCRPVEVHFTTLTNLLQMEKTTFQELYSQNSSIMDEKSRHVHKQSEYIAHAHKKSRLDRANNVKGPAFSYPINPDNLVRVAPSSDYHLHVTPDSTTPEVENFEALSEEIISPLSSIDFVFTQTKDANSKGFRTEGWEGSEGKSKVQQNGLLHPQETRRMGPHVPLSNHSIHQEIISQPGPRIVCNQPPYHNHHHNHQQDVNKSLQLQCPYIAEPAKVPANRENDAMQQKSSAPKLSENSGERISAENEQIDLENKFLNPESNKQVHPSDQANSRATSKISKPKKGKTQREKNNAVDWDSLRKEVQARGLNEERSKDAQDSLDYEAVRLANVDEISNAIRERGMNNMLAERIKEFLNRLVRDHGSIDLEWLRNVPPDKAKDYLLSIRGLGLKSVECVRLLTLHHLAFPVDTNVGRIAVRLGWVPLQPLPESLQLHLLELYPVLESIQKYLWPRLCKLDQRTLYELHYQLITFGKVFCTKSKPNCNACPMRGECRHFASAFASARLALPGPEEKSIVSSSVPIAHEVNPAVVINQLRLPPPENNSLKETAYESRNCEPIIEEPATPEHECTEILESDIEDSLYEDPDEIPIIKLNVEELTVNLQSYMQEKMQLQEADMSKALVALKPEAASIPTPKLKNVSRLRTEHQVYELPDSHPLLEGMDRLETDDPSPYLLAIWTPGETANSIQPPETSCGLQANKLCNETTCYSCNSVREANAQTVRGTILIPCRTAMRGSFPLNGTYFQVNEVFADHESSLNPIDVPRSWIWNLRRRTVYFGTSVSTIFKGLSTEGIQFCFWRGFVCVRGFDQKTRAPRPLIARLHFPASKLVKAKSGTKNKQDMLQI